MMRLVRAAGAVATFVVVALRFGAWRFDARRRERLAIAAELSKLSRTYSRLDDHRAATAIDAAASWLRAAAGEVSE